MKKNDKGFTLIELLAVIVVLAIIMVIATMAVNRQIKKARKDANDINKEVIAKATKTCLVENAQEDCDTIEKLQEKGYLEDFEDPWTGESENLDNSYAIIINEDGTDAKVIYFGEGITEEVETPPEEYFSWCNSAHTCTDGLTSEGKEWLQKHDDILIIPDNVTTIKNCQASSKDCTSFSGVTIKSLIIYNDDIKIEGTAFNGATINVVKIDSFENRYMTFQNTTIDKLILGNVDNSKTTIIEHSFSNSKLGYVKIENANLEFEIFSNSTIDTLILGEKVGSIDGNCFWGVPINKLVISGNDMVTVSRNNPFRGSSINEVIITDSVSTLPHNEDVNWRLIANNHSTRYEKVGNLVIEGDKTRFSVEDLYYMGFNCKTIANALYNDTDGINKTLTECINTYGKTTEDKDG